METTFLIWCFNHKVFMQIGITFLEKSITMMKDVPV